MARRRRRATRRFSAEESRQALAVLVQEGKLAVGDVRRALQRRERLIRALRVSLAALGEDAGAFARSVGRRAVPVLGRVARAAAPVVGRVAQATKRAKPRISAATRKMYRKQGEYLAALRPLTKAARARVKAIREKSGVDGAIAAAKQMMS